MKEGRQIVKEAVRDAKSLREAALESAKNEIVEALVPGLKALLDKTVRSESVDRYRGSESDYYATDKERKYEEGTEKGEPHMDDTQDKMGAGKLDMESLAAFFPQIAEIGAEGEGGGDEPAMPPCDDDDQMMGKKHKEEEDEAAIPMLGMEGADAGLEEAKDEEGEMDEQIEISEAELKKVYEQALQMEVQVKKGFGDVTGGGELDQAFKDTGIADKKAGEAFWEKEEPPAAEDMIPEGVQLPESVKKMIRAGMAENKALRAKLAESNKKLTEAYKAVRFVGGKLHEVNLFNAKVLHVNRLLNKHAKLTSEQKKTAIESLDRAKSIAEVKNIYESINGMLISESAKRMSESTARKPHANAQRARTSGAPNEKVLRESVDRGQNQAGNERWKRLAGLVK
jgi:hypothetical protein